MKFLLPQSNVTSYIIDTDFLKATAKEWIKCLRNDQPFHESSSCCAPQCIAASVNDVLYCSDGFQLITRDELADIIYLVIIEQALQELK